MITLPATVVHCRAKLINVQFWIQDQTESTATSVSSVAEICSVPSMKLSMHKFRMFCKELNMPATKPRMTKVKVAETQSRGHRVVLEASPSAKLIQNNKMIPAKINDILKGEHFILRDIMMPASRHLAIDIVTDLLIKQVFRPNKCVAKGSQ